MTAINTAVTPTPNEARAPWAMRFITSRPCSSVPIGCSGDGGSNWFIKSESVLASYGKMIGTKTAISRKKIVTTMPTRARRLEMRRL